LSRPLRFARRPDNAGKTFAARESMPQCLDPELYVVDCVRRPDILTTQPRVLFVHVPDDSNVPVDVSTNDFQYLRSGFKGCGGFSQDARHFVFELKDAIGFS